MEWSLARSRAQCAVQKAVEKCINWHTIDKIERPFSSGHATARTTQEFTYSNISVNKSKLSVTKHGQTQSDLNTHVWYKPQINCKYKNAVQRDIAHRHTHTHTHWHSHTHTHTHWHKRVHTHTHGLGGGGGINYMQIWRDKFLRLAWKKMLMLTRKSS